MNFRRLLLACTGLITLAAPSASNGQSADAIVFDDIMVTARRVEERLQDTSAAVTAVTAAELAPSRAETLEDAVMRSPNTYFNAQGGPISIRGISSLGISGGVDRQPAVGVFIDDVYLARPMGYPLMTYGLERVEVVRGSQSLLYGKNTIGGAVNLVLPSPDGTVGGEAMAGLGTDGLKRGALRFQTPLGDRFAILTTIERAASRGYIKNEVLGRTVNGIDALTVRSVVEGELATGTGIRLSVDYNKDKSDGGLWYAPIKRALDHKADHDLMASNKVMSRGASLRLNHDFGGVEITSITAVRGHTMDNWLDGDFTAAPYYVQGQIESQTQYSQEVRLASTGDRVLNWNAGVFFMREKFKGTQFYDYVGLARAQMSYNAFDQTADTLSAFGEVIWKPSAVWEIAAGARWTHDRKDTLSQIASPSGNYMMGMPGLAKDKASFSDVSPELRVTYKYADNSLAYAKLARGYKSGGISPYIEHNGSANKYDPEKTTTVELGWRTAAANGAWTIAATAYWTDWKDQQAVIYTSPTTRVYRNAAEATSRGFELEGTARLGNGARLYAGYGFTDARYDDFVDQVMGQDHSGNRIPYAPRNSVNVGLDWEREIASEIVLAAGVNYTWRDSHAFTPDNSFRQGPVGLLDASVALGFNGWKATVYGKNLTDRRYLRNYFNWGTDIGVGAEGRTLGMTLARKF